MAADSLKQLGKSPVFRERSQLGCCLRLCLPLSGFYDWSRSQVNVLKLALLRIFRVRATRYFLPDGVSSYEYFQSTPLESTLVCPRHFICTLASRGVDRRLNPTCQKERPHHH